MKLIVKLLGSSVLALASLTASAVVPAPMPYSGLVVFGDSLSDGGNDALLGAYNPFQVITGNNYIPNAAYAAAPGDYATFSNGPVWVTPFAAMLNLTVKPSMDGGTNFAFGGATTSGGSVPSLLAQTNMYLGGTGGHASSTALYVVAGGGNNARDTFSSVAALNDFGAIGSVTASGGAAYANDVGMIVDQLQAAGAQHIIVWNTPNIGMAPVLRGIPLTGSGLTGSQVGSLVAGAYNGALQARLAGEAGVQIFDLYGVVSNMPAGTFTNTTDACGAPSNSGVCPADISKALFWDGLHPTTAAQAYVAEQLYAVAVPVPEPTEVAMMLVGLLVVGRAVARRKSI
jgi:outer membrane lipase/esterase